MGIATLDLINEVATYPDEDDEVRALAHRRIRGGNVTNSLCVLSQLGHRCHWAGMLGEDSAAALVLDDLRRHHIGIRGVTRVPGAMTPTSYITLNRANGSRTIIHFRDLPELDAETFARIPLDGIDWVHFEGRNPSQTQRMIQRVRREAPEIPVSVEFEKLRDGIAALFDGPQVLIASRSFARASGFDRAGAFLEDLAHNTQADLCIVAWGEQGAAYQPRGGLVQEVPSYRPETVVDTLGAGDVFNAGIIHGLLTGLDAAHTLSGAVELAGRKCARVGLELA